MSELAGMLAPGARYEGHLSFTGRVRIDGELRGSLKADDFVEIGATGAVQGDIDAPQVLIAGSVVGIVRARERITVAATGHVEGRVVTPWLDVRPGARLRCEVLVERPA